MVHLLQRKPHKLSIVFQMLKGQGQKVAPQAIAKTILANIPENDLIDKVKFTQMSCTHTAVVAPCVDPKNNILAFNFLPLKNYRNLSGYHIKCHLLLHVT